MGKKRNNKPKPKKVVTPEKWRCVTSWLKNFMGRDFKKGDEVLIHPNQKTDEVMAILQSNFEEVKIEAVTIVSKNIEEVRRRNHG